MVIEVVIVEIPPLGMAFMSAKKANACLVLVKKKAKCRARKITRSKETSGKKFKC